MDEMHAHMSAILMKADKKHIELKVVGMAGQCWVTKEMNDKLKEQQEVCQSEGIHTEA